jgi:hypothetical protein
LLVEAIEDHFVPVLIYNNKEEDAELLQSFDEPSWNNPVVRFLDHTGHDLIPRKDGVWQAGPLARRMVTSLQAANRQVPAFLEYVADGWQDKYRRASFAMA